MRIKVISFVILALIFSFCAMQAQKMSSQETEMLLKQTQMLNIKYYDALIRFVLTSNDSLYNEALSIYYQQDRNLSRLKKSGVGNYWTSNSYSFEKTIVESNYLLYGDFFKTQVQRNTGNANKKVNYDGKVYLLSKYRKEQFERLLKSIRTDEKIYRH